MTTLKDYLTADMVDNPLTYREWLDSVEPMSPFEFDMYRIEPFRPIYGYSTNLLTYPYTIPYRADDINNWDDKKAYFAYISRKDS